MLVHVVRHISLARASLNWLILEGTVLETRVDARRGRRRYYIPVVRYQYKHGGQVYEGDRIIFSGQSVATSSSDEAKRFICQFEVGTRIPYACVRRSPA